MEMEWLAFDGYRIIEQAASKKPANGSQPEPGTWPHVEEGGATQNGHTYAAGTAVAVTGKNDEKSGTITGLIFGDNGQPLYVVAVGGKEYRLGADKFRVVNGG
jgi:hypothetical protein